MKRVFFLALASLVTIISLAQKEKDNTLLWRISGKDIKESSYLFGTIHLICADDIEVSDSLKKAIRGADQVYLELDMDNIFELLSVASKMKMNGDTTLADLLTPEDYSKVKDFFTEQNGMVPFSMLERFKPMVAASTLMQSAMDCEHALAMEQLVMKEAKSSGKGIKGLETMAFQMSIFDSIPYAVQAEQLVQYVRHWGNKEGTKHYDDLVNAYRAQELSKLEDITKKEDAGMERFTEILLYNRNETWIRKLQSLMQNKSLVVAVGAGHLPGARGLINLLRKAGYKVEPVRNDMIRLKNQKEL